jgi:Leu/Phe-tRNA-protein transferase
MDVKYTLSGFIYITPEDNCHKIVDVMLETNYNEEFCIADKFDPEFIVKLMEAGFLVMSMNIAHSNKDDVPEPFYVLLPKLHLVRSALFYENLHIRKSIRRFIKTHGESYELRADTDFDYIVDRCVEKHGSDWLTPPLVDCIKRIRRGEGVKELTEESSAAEQPALNPNSLSPSAYPYPASFALFKDERIVAGEFGVICGKVYTSYSGFYEENNTGTLQIILAAEYLKENGFSFFDMGMPLDYKTDLGAVDISPENFIKLFRA